MPNLIVYIDLRDGQPTAPSLFAVSEARRIAHAAGVTVFALVMSEPMEVAQADALAARLGPVGADRVLVCEGVGLGGPPLDVTHGRALMIAAERIPPIVVLFPAGGPGEELGPSLASRMSAAFGSAVDVEISGEPGPLADGVGRVRFRRWRADRSGARALDPVEIERPVVAILGAHGAPRELGNADIDVDVISCPAAIGAGGPLVELSSEADELAAVALARGLVIVNGAVPAAIVTRLRAALPADVSVVVSEGAGQDAGALGAVLASSSPEFVLDVGGGALADGIAVSPRARLARIDLQGAPARPHGAATELAPDIIWSPAAAPDGEPWESLVAALAPLASPGGKRDGA